jgi:hypothetical protein
MANISVTHTFTNGTAADASQVNTNFTDIINGLSDGTKDISISAATFAGTLTANGNTIIGNSSADDLTVTASLASSIPIKTTNSYDIGSATLGLRLAYFGNGTNSNTVGLRGGVTSASYTINLPVAAPAAGQRMYASSATQLEFAHNKLKLTAITNSSTPYTVLSTDENITCDCSSGAITVNLAAATGTGKVLKITKIDTSLANIVTIDGNSTETINGATTITLATQYESVEILDSASGIWTILNRRIPSVWASFNPSDTTYAWATTSSRTFFWRRVGDSIQVKARIVVSSAVSAAISFIADESIPSGLSFDTAKGPSGSHSVGTWHAIDASAASSADDCGGTALLSGSSIVFVMNTPTEDGLDNTVPMTWTTGDVLAFFVEIPVTNWEG